MDTRIYVQEISIKQYARKMYIYDDMTAEHIAYVNILGSYLHYAGDQYGSHSGVSAVIRITNGNPEATVAEALRNGIVNGRDDRS
jgi:hypothetical protein